MKRKFYYTYVLKSQRDHKLYIGWSDNLRSRLEKHKKGLVVATRNRLPVELLYYEACTDEAPRPASRGVVSLVFGGAESAEAEERRIHPRPADVMGSSAKADKDLAIKREKALKTGFGRKYLKERIVPR